MKVIGKILALPIRIINIPARIVEKLVDPDSELGDKNNVASAPLETLAEVIEEVFGEKNRK